MSESISKYSGLKSIILSNFSLMSSTHYSIALKLNSLSEYFDNTLYGKITDMCSNHHLCHCKREYS